MEEGCGGNKKEQKWERKKSDEVRKDKLQRENRR